MGLSYDFERFMKRYPRTESDRRRLVPERAARNLLDLRATLEDPQGLNFVPAKSETQLLLATWNIQHFGSTERYDESFWYIAEILSHFDLITIQEVKQSLQDLEVVTRLLGPWWSNEVNTARGCPLGPKKPITALFAKDNFRSRLCITLIFEQSYFNTSLCTTYLFKYELVHTMNHSNIKI